MSSLYVLEGVASSICYDNNCDSLIWQYIDKGDNSTSTLYHIINFGQVVCVFIRSVRKVHIPLVDHLFLWILSQNRLMTRDTLKKMKMHMPEDCIFYIGIESPPHFFIGCIVTRHIWPTFLVCLSWLLATRMNLLIHDMLITRDMPY
jgi:hypothetical protein